MPSIKVDAFVGVRHTIERHLICAMQGQFPVLARGDTDILGAVFRTGAGHYGLSGTLATARSLDGGKTWSDPSDVAPRGHDIRNPALGIIGQRWVLGYWEAGIYCYPPGDGGVRKWRDPQGGGAEPDMFVITSDDRGATWSSRTPYRSSRLAWVSPFGRIIERRGTLLMPAYGGITGAARMESIIIRSTDGGATWGDESQVCANGNETSICNAGDRLLAAVRRDDASTSLQTSDDGGYTWSSPRAVTRANEHPADLCVLASSGRLLMTFGRRMRPLGAGALTSTDGGETWDSTHEVLLAGDGIGNDVGYPSTVQLSDTTLVTAMYFARGSAGSDGWNEWGDTSCQALRYPEALVAPR